VSRRLVFLYGTLMRGRSAHHLLGDDVRFVDIHAARGWTLLDLGEYPGAVRGTGEIHGEVFDLPRDRLLDLDDYEEVPDDYVHDEVATPHGRALIYRYVGSLEGAKAIPSGRWTGP